MKTGKNNKERRKRKLGYDTVRDANSGNLTYPYGGQATLKSLTAAEKHSFFQQGIS